MSLYDVIIVGAGPAGLTAAIYAVRANMKVILLEKLSPGGQMINTNEIENYPAFGRIEGADLAIQMFEHSQELGVNFDYKTVLSIEEKEDGIKEVICEEEDSRYHGRAVILATGTVPRTLDIPGEDQFKGAGISWCAICDGIQYRDKDVVVIGGGNSAVEESIYLSGIVNRLTVVTMFDLTADPVACDRLREMQNVTIYPYQEILAFFGKDKLEGIRFKSTKDGEEREVKCDGVFEYIGLKPTADCFKPLGILDDFGCIVADSEMKTSVSGIFAAGDILDKKLRQVITACSDGAIAANSAAKYVEEL